MDSTLQSASTGPAKSTFACVRCSERKVKCNKQIPCSACIGHKAQCIYRQPKPPRRRRNISKANALDERLKRYEELLREKDIDPKQTPVASQEAHQQRTSRSGASEYVWQLPMAGTASADSQPKGTEFKPLLLHGQASTKFVDNLWFRVAEEIQDPEETPGEESANYSTDSGRPDTDFSYVLDWSSPNTRPSHPSAEHIHILWRAFAENVNPLLKLIHVPTLQPAIEKAASNPQQVPPGFEALMFAVYSLAVLSLMEDECDDLLQDDRAALLHSFVTATRVSLCRARFMSSTSIVVLQALILHIISIRDSQEPRAVWSLTGVAIRVAEGMGMRIDGELLGLSPFETEIRRRVWWQLKMHDFRAAELAGQAKFKDFDVDETAPKKPANVNDNDLHPKMLEIPPNSMKPTEMVWCAIRADLSGFAQTQMARMRKQSRTKLTSEEFVALDDMQMKDKFIQELEDMLETRHLRFCDPSQPLHFMSLLGGRLALNLIRFIAHHPRRWATMNRVPASEQEFLWNIAIELLEKYNILQSNPHIRRFAWNVPYFIQWHAVIHVLDRLRGDPLRSNAARAWELIEALYQNNSGMLLSINKPIFAAVGNICLKAFSAREEALRKRGDRHSDPPEYIAKLRDLREAASARAEAKIVKSQEGTSGAKIGPTGAASNVSCPEHDPTTVISQIEAPQRQHTAANEPANLTLTTALPEDDTFWLNDCLYNGLFDGEGTDMMDLDMSDFLTEDYWLGNSAGDGIDWAQFDARFGNFDSMHPQMGIGGR